MRDRDVWAEYKATKEADDKAKADAKYEASKRALDSKYDQQKKSEEIVRASKLKDAYAAADRLNKPQWMKDNEARIANFKSDTKKTIKPTPTKVTKKEVTVETPTGNIGSRNSFDAGEVNPFAPKAAAEKLIDYPSRTADAPTPAEVADIVKSKDESRFSSSNPMGMKKGGKVKCMSSGGSSKASSRGDGCAQRGKTRGRMI